MDITINREVIIATISVISGGLIGYLISYFFYFKAKRGNEIFIKDFHNISHSLEQVFMHAKYPTIFDSTRNVKIDFSNKKPRNTDIPSIAYFLSESKNIKRGKKRKILARFVDLGRNLPTDGIKIINHLNKYSIPLSWEGFGWGSFEIEIPKDAPTGRQKVTIKLEDTLKNKNSYDYEYNIQ